MRTQVKTSSGSTQPDRQSRYGLLLGFKIFSVSIVCFSLGSGLNAAPTTKSDAELSRALIGTWEIMPSEQGHAVSKLFVSMKADGTFKRIAILKFLGYHGRVEHQGKWRVKNGRLITQEAVGSGPQVGYPFPIVQDVSLQGNAVILHTRDSEEQLHEVPIPSQLPPLLPPHWMDKLILEKPTPVYPIEARRIVRFQGRGFYVLHINQKTGTVESVSIARSTGSKVLDEAAISALKRWRIQPETMGVVGIPVRFYPDAMIQRGCCHLQLPEPWLSLCLVRFHATNSERLSKRSAVEQTFILEDTWCDACKEADLGMIHPVELEENGQIIVEGHCARCGGSIRTKLNVEER